MPSNDKNGRTQIAVGLFGEALRELRLPAASEEAMCGLSWGEPGELFSPAFWAHQVWLFDLGSSPRYALGETLIEEVAVCLLGGFGFKSELGWEAFKALKKAALLVPGAGQQEIEGVLRSPLIVDGRAVRYRFPHQKAVYLAAFLAKVDECGPAPIANGVLLRDWLLQFPGIGPKTASWVARNWLNSDDVAIIDIHIYRAGLLTGFFDKGMNVDRHYLQLERKFTEFARAINVRASDLDAVMWEQMREFGDFPIKLLRRAGLPVSAQSARISPIIGSPIQKR